MSKKYLLILLVVCIFGGVFFLERAVNNIADQQKTPPVQVVEADIPEKGFKDLNITYYGDTGRYRMDTSLTSIVQETGGSIEFTGLAAILKDGEELIQKFDTPEGFLSNEQGRVELSGPVLLKAGNYEISLNTVNVDLNQGQLSATGPVQVKAANLNISAENMQADFRMQKLRFTGRPRLVVTTESL